MDLEQFEAAIKPGKTSLASVMSVNNEIGVVQPIKEIGELCRKHKVIYLVVVLVHFEKGKTRQIRDMHELLFTRCFFNYYFLDEFSCIGIFSYGCGSGCWQNSYECK